MEKLGRRSLIKLAGAAAGAGALGALTGNARALETTSAVKPSAANGPKQIPWPYEPLDQVTTAEKAFLAYAKGHCMHGVFDAIQSQMADKLGGKFQDFPYGMFAYGAGGAGGWGTLCGALNGAAAAFQLFSANPQPLIDSLYTWYEREALPNYVPKGTKFPNIASVSGSPLCHVSIGMWVKKSGKAAFSPERKERCGVLTAAVAQQAVVLLNAQAKGAVVDAALAKKTTECMDCHEQKSPLENARARMSCGGCHFALGTKHKDI